MTQMTLGERLKALRSERGVSLGKLEKAVNITASTLGDYENDNKNPSIERLKRLAEFYGVSLDYLAGLSEARSVNISIRQICKKTGLSEDAINTLINMKMARGEDTYISLDTGEISCLQEIEEKLDEKLSRQYGQIDLINDFLEDAKTLFIIATMIDELKNIDSKGLSFRDRSKMIGGCFWECQNALTELIKKAAGFEEVE